MSKNQNPVSNQAVRIAAWKIWDAWYKSIDNLGGKNLDLKLSAAKNLFNAWVDEKTRRK